VSSLLTIVAELILWCTVWVVGVKCCESRELDDANVARSDIEYEEECDRRREAMEERRRRADEQVKKKKTVFEQRVSNAIRQEMKRDSTTAAALSLSMGRGAGRSTTGSSCGGLAGSQDGGVKWKANPLAR